MSRIAIPRYALHSLPTLLPLLMVGVMGCVDSGLDGSESAAPPLVDADVDLRIGSLDDPERMLTSVGAILPSPDGRFYVSQPQDAQVRIHGPDGGLIDRFGSSGEGPGEFQGLSGMGWWGESGDTLWVGDFQLARLGLFEASGRFIRSIPLRVEPYREVMTVRTVTAITPEGTALATPSFPSHLLAEGEIDAIPLLRFDLDSGEPPEVVVETIPGNRQLAVRLGTGMGFTSQPYSDRPLVLVSGAARRVVVVERHPAADPAEASVHLTALNPVGDTVWVHEIVYDPLPIPRSEVDSIAEARIETWLGFAEQTGAGRRTLEAQIRENLFAPDYRPPIAGGFVAPDGSTWLRWTTDPDEEVHRWWRLDAEGTPVARIELPGNVTLRAHDGHFGWGVETDEFDVPYVVRLRIGEG